MGRKKRGKGPAADSGASAPAKGSPVKLIILAVVVCAAVGLAIASWRSAPPPAPTTRAAVPPPPPALAKERAATPPAPRDAQPLSESAAATPESYRPLLGQWVRPDGGYVLAIQGVAEDGSATVGYFNPQPIHVGTARASLEDDTLELFVKLQDTNYPGSTYTLRHDPQEDQLVGIYFQAVQRASYDVVFVRR